MNKTRRNELKKASENISAAQGMISAVREEEEAYENMPDSLKDGAKGEAMYTAIDVLEGIDELLEEILQQLEEIIEG